MRVEGERESDNVEVRRGSGGAKAGAMGGGALILVVIAMLFGLDPSKLLSGLGGSSLGAPASAGSNPSPATPQQLEAEKFVRVVVASTEDVWKQVFQQAHQAYTNPTVTIFYDDRVVTACGTQSTQVGPFYCPGDQHVYLDTNFFVTMKNRLGAPGDFAQAYVIAHEVGHHVQNLLGYSEKVHQMRGRVSAAEQNKWSVRLELQADFLAGVWAHHAQKLRNIIEQGDIEEAMNAAAAVGDDKLQREATGVVRPESFTHGSSEQRMQAFKLGLQTGDINKASDFFVDYPTGFRVFPVGKAGATALPVLHKLVAVGRELRGRKLAISLSPSSYFAEEVDAGYYGGNFSELHATELAFSTAISRGLKRDAARRMLEYPKTIEDNWLLQTALRRLAGDTALDRALYAALFPLGKLQLWIGRAQDHFEAAEHIEDIRAPLAAEKRPRKMNWAATLRQAGEIAKKMKATAKKPGAPALAKRPKGSRDKAWLATLEKADEWTDFELVLRALEELGARPLILSMPVHGEDLENFGVSKTARSAYEDRMRGLTGRYHAPFVYFKQNEEDPNFFYDNLDHLSPSGWIYYNKMLDDFFHERLTTLEPQPIPPRL